MGGEAIEEESGGASLQDSTSAASASASNNNLQVQYRVKEDSDDSYGQEIKVKSTKEVAKAKEENFARPGTDNGGKGKNVTGTTNDKSHDKTEQRNSNYHLEESYISDEEVGEYGDEDAHDSSGSVASDKDTSNKKVDSADDSIEVYHVYSMYIACI